MVRVYQNVAGSWAKIGADIDGEAAGDFNGRSVSLSSDGTIVAIGAPHNDGTATNAGSVRVYQNVAGTWTKIGADIDGEAAGDESGISVSLSNDGTIVAIGAPYSYAADIESGRSVSLPSDGATVTIPNSFNGRKASNAGHVRMYDLKIPLSTDNAYVLQNFVIYHNPSNGVVNISLENNLELEKVTFYNSLGQMVKTTSTKQISTSDLAKGTYFVEVLTNEGQATKKIIVQ